MSFGHNHSPPPTFPKSNFPSFSTSISYPPTFVSLKKKALDVFVLLKCPWVCGFYWKVVSVLKTTFSGKSICQKLKIANNFLIGSRITCRATFFLVGFGMAWVCIDLVCVCACVLSQALWVICATVLLCPEDNVSL